MLGLSLWISSQGAETSDRIAGVLAVGLLVPAGVLFVAYRARALGSQSDAAPLAWLQYLVYVLGIVAAAEFGWAFLDLPGHSTGWLWLHRNVWTLVALALATLVYGVLLARAWARAGLGTDGARWARYRGFSPGCWC